MPAASVWAVCGFLLQPRPLALLAMRRLSMTTALRLYHHLRATTVPYSGVLVFLQTLWTASCLLTTHRAPSQTPTSNSPRLSSRTTSPSTIMMFGNALSPAVPTTPQLWLGNRRAQPPPLLRLPTSSVFKRYTNDFIVTSANRFISLASSTTWPMTPLVCSTCPTLRF